MSNLLISRAMDEMVFTPLYVSYIAIHSYFYVEENMKSLIFPNEFIARELQRNYYRKI